MSKDEFGDAFYIKLALTISYFAIALGAIFGFFQVLERVPGIDIISAKTYYMFLTAHGVLMALVFTTFFIIALALYIINSSLRIKTNRTLNIFAFAFIIIGTLMATFTIILGEANVLYTFYPPLMASPAFYIGVTLLIIGTWIFTTNIFLTIKKWRVLEGNNRIKLPLEVFGLVSTLIIWILATVGIALEALFLLIPWSLGFTERIDPLLARNLFWYFGHPLVYFWLLPAYIVWYTILPKILNVRIFSDLLSRVVFVLFILFSTPVGYHHQFMDPGIMEIWKYLHTITTYSVLVPSMITAFTITATMEMSARLQGGRGLFGWITKLPWRNPTFSAIAFSMILFALGGASGAVNAGYNLNYIVHNTAWIPGHLHLTVGSAVTLTFMGISYALLPQLVKRKVNNGLALIQVCLWFVGVIIFSSSMLYLGILGSPRRVYDLTYYGSLTSIWSPYLAIAAIGGTLMFISVILFLYIIIRTVISGERVLAIMLESAESKTFETEPLGLVDNLKLFTAIAILIILVAYVLPTIQIINMNSPGAPPVWPNIK